VGWLQAAVAVTCWGQVGEVLLELLGGGGGLWCLAERAVQVH
jgi:hypothetical protein